MQGIQNDKNTCHASDYRYLSDAACKQLLGDKLILACILKGCIPEFKDRSVSEIETKYIEGEPEIGTVGVHAETTNKRKAKQGSKIHGMSNEDTTDTEGKVIFAYDPDKDETTGSNNRGYRGAVITDWWNRGEHYKEILAGNDVKMAAGFPDRVRKAMELGLVTRENLKKCAVRVLEMICKLD